MATLGNLHKYSMGFTAVNTGMPSTTRTIAGLNLGSGTGTSGPLATNALGYLASAIDALSLGTVTKPRYIDERDVIL